MQSPLGIASLLAGSVFASYLLNHEFGFLLGTAAWTFWLPNAVAAAFLMRRPVLEWPLLLLAMLIGKSTASLYLLGHVWSGTQLEAGLAGAAEVLLAAAFMRRVAPHPLELIGVVRIISFVGLVVVVAPVIPSAVESFVWGQSGSGDFLPLARSYYVGDSLGLLVITPLILAWWHPENLREWPSKGGRAEAVVLGIGTLALGAAIFAAPPQTASVKPLPYLIVPLLMWGASRFGLRGGTTQVALISLMAVSLTARGYGPFINVSEDPNLRVAALQLYLSVIAVATLLMASIEGQHARLVEEQRRGESLSMLGELATRVAHDFNNDLTAIVGWTELMDGGDARDREEAVTEIRHSADRATRLVGELLAFGSKGDSEPTVVVLAELIESLEPMLRRSLGGQHELQVEVDPETWPVRADPHQLEVALINLAVNARDAMDKGGTLTVGAKNVAPSTHRGDQIALFARDNGPGIPPLEIQRIFDPFYTTKKSRGGTGLGLTTVRRVAERYGGDVRVDSQLGEGTTFEIILPRTSGTG